MSVKSVKRFITGLITLGAVLVPFTAHAVCTVRTTYTAGQQLTAVLYNADLAHIAACFSGTFTGSITSTLGSIAADTPNFTGTATWTNAGVTYTGVKLNVTDTSSASGSLLADLQVGGASQWKVSKAGATSQLGSLTGTTALLAQGSISTDVQILSLTSTWADTGTHTAIKLNITDSGPANTASKLLDLQVGGTSVFNVTKLGVVTLPTGSTLKIHNSGASITRVILYQPTLAVLQVLAATCAEQTFTVSGLATTDSLIVNPFDAPTAGVQMTAARVSAVNTLALTFCNATAGNLTPPTAQYDILAFRR